MEQFQTLQFFPQALIRMPDLIFMRLHPRQGYRT